MASVLPTPRKDLEFIPVQDRGQQMILVRDRFGLVREGTVIAPQLYRFLYLLDSFKEFQELQLYLSRQAGGVLVSQAEIQKVLNNLEQAYLLDSKQYRSAKEGLKSAFAARETRPASHAGRSYPDNAEALSRQLDRILGENPAQAPARPVKGLVAPHIDLAVGAKGYGSAYSRLQGASYQRVVVLGIGHQMEQGLFSLTGKTYETVLGPLPADRDSMFKLCQSGELLVADSDYEHCSEHSIEFQALFLRHLLGNTGCQLVPILCGSMRHFLSKYNRQGFLDAAGQFLEALQKIVAQESTLIVAGVDFSHIGPKFGHEQPAPRMQSEAKEHDSALLDALCRRDPDRFWHISREVDDCYHVCGFSALACLLEVLPPCRGELLHYEMWHEGPTSSAVSFAAVDFSIPWNGNGTEGVWS